MPDARFDVHLVVHTHWDREWYLPAGRFRQRLVELIDALLDRPSVRGERFLLDGQTVVLSDYLDVRPERRDALASALRDRAIEAGPWFVLADELTPSGESLVRNLLQGRRDLASFGATSPPVLYSPDAFGHPAALPTLAAGFGLSLIILWRGLGGEHWPNADLFRWRAPNGDEVLVSHLPRDGYEFGSELPTSEDTLRARWTRQRAQLAARARTRVLLYQNGADHHARQHDLDAALDALARIAEPDRVVPSSLSRYASELLVAAESVEVPSIEGELRDSYGYTWTLQGTFGSRSALKRRNAIAERRLLRESEPFSALAKLRAGRSRGALVRAAWRTLLLNHPHDTLCGCSIDDVAGAASTRLDDVIAQADGIRDDSVLDLIGHDRVAARTRRADWTPIVVVRNAAPRPRAGVAEVELLEFIADVPVGPGSGANPLGRSAPDEIYDRTESPEHYPDNDLVRRTRVAAWVPEIPALGVRCFTVDEVRAMRGGPRLYLGDSFIENDALRVEVADGRIALVDRASGHRIDDLIAWENVGDRGDLYTFSQNGEPDRSARLVRASIRRESDVRASVDLAWLFGEGDLRGTLIVDAGAPFVRLIVHGWNLQHDHRLRVLLATGVRDGSVFADAMFGPIERRAIDVSLEASAIERPPRTAPLHHYVTVTNADRGATIFSDGLAEYEAMSDGAIAITILRAIGELSRNDLPERPGHAGWPVPAPESQSLGPWHAELAIMPHGPRDDATIAAIERASDDVLVPLVGTTLRSALAVYTPSAGAELRGDGLAFSTLKESENGEWLVARCVNLTERTVHGSWHFAAPITEARLARLDETPGDALVVSNGVVEFVARPRDVVTIVVR